MPRETGADRHDADQPGGTPAVSREEALAHLARILDSREFRAARNRARFLDYVVQRLLDGAEDSLKEYTIGVEVFDRGVAFDPRTDGVVRTQAGLVRKHLERYYATDGRDEPIEIVLPKGHYIPELRRHKPQAAAAAAAVREAELETAAAAVSGPGAQSEPDVESPALMAAGRPAWQRPATIGAGAAAVVAVLMMALVATRGVTGIGGMWPWGADAVNATPNTPGTFGSATRAGRASGVPSGVSGSGSSAGQAALDERALAPVWGPFFAPGASNVLAFGIPQFFSGGGVWVRDVTVNTATPPAPSAHLAALRKQLGALQPAEAYTGIGEAYGVYLLSRFFLGRSHELRVMRSPTLSWDNLKHDNVIFLTSARFKTLADQLSYPTEFQHVLGDPNRLAVLHPGPGEQAEYRAGGPTAPGEVSLDYAIITMWPGKLPGRRVLVLSGGHTWGTQAAAEYVTESGYLRELNGHLLACAQRRGLAAHPEFFQVLLRVEIRDNQPLGARYLTHRDLALTETGEPARASIAAR